MARFNLPDIDFVDVDPEELESIAVAKFEELQKVSLTDADPRRKFIQAVVYLATLLANGIDYAGKQNLLAYASDNSLDHIGAKKNVFRLGPKPSKTIVRFEVHPVETSVIPQGTRMTVDEVVFLSVSDVVIKPGDAYVDVTFECEEPGTIGNGFLPGQITDLVDSLPWVSKAYNITKSEGGEDLEEDDAFADRIRQSNAQYSTAGPEDAYRFHAKSVNPLITDVQVISPREGRVQIVPLLKDGEIPDTAILEEIFDKVNAKTVRPLTDYVAVTAPEQVYYDIDVTYYVPMEKSNVLADVQAAINQAIEEYKIWQRSKLGRGIDQSELNSRIKNAGGVRVSVNSPSSYRVLTKSQVAVPSNAKVTFGGFVDD